VRRQPRRADRSFNFQHPLVAIEMATIVEAARRMQSSGTATSFEPIDLTAFDDRVADWRRPFLVT
jgi:hypothetical protein